MLQPQGPFSFPIEYRPGQRLVQLAFKVTPEDLKRLDIHTERMGCHRSALVRALLRQALDQLETTERPSSED